ncbi:MAG: hypothetical protein ACRDUY_11685, partial [Nitriliruptorales bacterium]
GPVSGLFAVSTRADGSMVTSVAGSDRVHVRVTSDAATGPPEVLLDLDSHPGTGAWTYGSIVSSAGWDLRIDAEGRLFRHEGRPRDWDWEPADGGRDYRWSSRSGETLVCLPLPLLGRNPSQLGIGASLGEHWLPRPFLPAVTYPRVQPPGPGGPVRVPGRIAFAYQYRPWVVRDCTDPFPATMACASAAYAPFDHVVLAGSLEEPGHPSHDGTVRLIARLREDHADQEVWGYVSLRSHAGRPQGLEQVLERVGLWAETGVTGIFLDEADLCPGGDDCPEGGVTRATQVTAVRAMHDLGLAVFANGFSVTEVLGPVDRTPSPLSRGTAQRAADMFLVENPTVAHGQWRGGLEWEASSARFEAALRYASRSGVRLAALDTGAGWVEDSAAASAQYVAGWWRAVQAGADAYAFTNPAISATDELGPNLPVLAPPPEAELLEGLRFASPALRIGELGRRIVRDLLDCRGDVAGAIVVEVTDSSGTMAPRLVLAADPLPTCDSD